MSVSLICTNYCRTCLISGDEDFLGDFIDFLWGGKPAVVETSWVMLTRNKWIWLTFQCICGLSLLFWLFKVHKWTKIITESQNNKSKTNETICALPSILMINYHRTVIPAQILAVNQFCKRNKTKSQIWHFFLFQTCWDLSLFVAFSGWTITEQSSLLVSGSYDSSTGCTVWLVKG